MLFKNIISGLLILFFVLFSGINNVSAQENKNIYETKISCSGIDSKIESVCEKNTFYNECNSQKWTVSGKTVELLQDHFVLYKWACLSSNEGEKIVLWAANGGSCDECERLEIWNPDGTKLIGWKKFDEEYERRGFPKTNGGDDFVGQFHFVNKGLKEKPLK